MTELEKIAYNCRKATFLIEKKQMANISLREKLELKIHLAGCSVCRLFEQQSLLINKLLGVMVSNTHSLDDNYKLSLQLLIEKRLNQK